MLKIVCDYSRSIGLYKYYIISASNLRDFPDDAAAKARQRHALMRDIRSYPIELM
jgi:hypothetical protein